MLASVYLFGELGAGYTQYLDDYTRDIFRNYAKQTKSGTQLLIHREDNTVYYVYIRRLGGSKYIGMCYVVSGVLISAHQQLFEIFEGTIDIIVTRGVILELSNDGNITSNLEKLHLCKGEFLQISDYLKMQFNHLDDSAIEPLPPVNYEINTTETKVFEISDSRTEIKKAIGVYPYVYIIKKDEKLTNNAHVSKDVKKDKSYKNYGIIFVVILLLVTVFISLRTCNNSTDSDKKISDSIIVVHDTVVVEKGVDVIDFIKSMYNEKKYYDYVFLKHHCTNRMLEKLRREYEYDDDGYAVWLFRSDAQEGPSDEYRIISVAPEENDWYTYSYYDMGIKGVNRIKIIKDGDTIKIDDIETINIDNSSYTHDNVEPENDANTNSDSFQDEGMTYRVTKNMFVRTGPGTSYEAQYSPHCDFESNNTCGVVVFKGSLVKVISNEQNGFVKVHQLTPENDRDEWNEGYVSAKLLEYVDQ